MNQQNFTNLSNLTEIRIPQILMKDVNFPLGVDVEDARIPPADSIFCEIEDWPPISTEPLEIDGAQFPENFYIEYPKSQYDSLPHQTVYYGYEDYKEYLIDGKIAAFTLLSLINNFYEDGRYTKEEIAILEKEEDYDPKDGPEMMISMETLFFEGFKKKIYKKDDKIVGAGLTLALGP
jgi:hypothetical protein